jgi:hypothetical protein
MGHTRCGEEASSSHAMATRIRCDDSFASTSAALLLLFPGDPPHRRPEFCPRCSPCSTSLAPLRCSCASTLDEVAASARFSSPMSSAPDEVAASTPDAILLLTSEL